MRIAAEVWSWVGPTAWERPAWRRTAATGACIKGSYSPTPPEPLVGRSPRLASNEWLTLTNARSRSRTTTRVGETRHDGSQEPAGRHASPPRPELHPDRPAVGSSVRWRPGFRETSVFTRWATRMRRGDSSGRHPLATRTLARWIGTPSRTELLVHHRIGPAQKAPSRCMLNSEAHG